MANRVRFFMSGLLCALVTACVPAPNQHKEAVVQERARGSARPMKVMSLIACTDQLLVALADREQIASLSFYSRNPLSSPIAEIAKTLPVNYITAEDVIATRPDLVLSTRFMPQPTRQTLERLGVRILLFDVPETVEASIGQVRAVGTALGQERRAEALIDIIEASAARQGAAIAQSALLTYPDGYAAGARTLVDDLMGRAGLINAASRYKIGRWGQVSLEELIASPPDVLMEQPRPNGQLSVVNRIVLHPALQRSELHVRRADVSSTMLYCGGPVIPKLSARFQTIALEGIKR